MNYLLVIGGATATGKTGLAIRLAQFFGTAVVSADSRQFYREMSIGTAKPTLQERVGVPHFFIDSLSVADDFSVGQFEKEALTVLNQIYQNNSVAILAGGSGLFIKAVCEGLDAFPPVPEAVKKLVEDGESEYGLGWLQQQLLIHDPAYYRVVDKNNPARLRRALEVCLASGQPYTYFLAQGQTPRNFTPIFIQLDLPRPELYERIDRRVDLMIEQGLEEEVRALLPWRHRPALNTVGYEEFLAFFDGKTNREEAIEKIKQHSRNYAKRQGTWFRKYGPWTVFHPADWEGILAFVQKKLSAQAD